MNGKNDVKTGAIFVVLDSLYLYFCGDIQPFTGKGTTPLTNRFIPYFWGIFMMVLSIALILRGLGQMKRAGKTEKGETQEKTKRSMVEWIVENREVLMSFAALFFYILLMEKIGFVIMTFLFLTAEILILTPKKDRNVLAAAITGVVVSALLYFIFGKTLHILLPVGIFSF